MLVSHLHFRGRELKVRAAARKLGLARDAYAVQGELYTGGPKKGKQRPDGYFRVSLSKKEDAQEHMREVSANLDGLLSFIAGLRARTKGKLEIEFTVGLTVGGRNYYTRTLRIGPEFFAKLGALDIRFELSAYPSSE